MSRQLAAGCEKLCVSWNGRRPGFTTVRWSDVDAVIGFKRDLLTTDLLCLAFEGLGLTIEVCEEDDGWDELLAALPERLPGALSRRQLLEAIVRPPFAECRTTVFRRSP